MVEKEVSNSRAGDPGYDEPAEAGGRRCQGSNCKPEHLKRKMRNTGRSNRRIAPFAMTAGDKKQYIRQNGSVCCKFR